MKELSSDEEHWLVVFAKYNPFFEDLSRYYLKNDFLSKNQYESLEKEIEKAEEDGKCILDIIDFRFLKEHAEENENLKEILDIYEEDAFLDESDFNTFIDIKLDLNPDFKKRELSTIKSENKSEEHRLNKIREFLPNNDQNEKLTYPKVCPNCNKRLAIYIGKNGAFFGCNGYPHCKFSFNIVSTKNILCPDCKSSMYERTGSRGIFLGCGSYPDCKFTYPIRISKNVESSTPPVKSQRKKIAPPEKDDSRKRRPIFVLELQNNKWWIGRSKNPKKMIAKQKDGTGSAWTRENRVIAIEEIIEDGDLSEITIRYMKNFGWKNVRSSSFNDSFYVYIPKIIKEYIKSQEGGLDYFKEKEEQTGPKDVYTLRLEKGKWYVGKSSNVKRRVEEMKKKGNTWTKMHSILALEEVRENADLKEVTLEYMRKYGWENVRGYAWSQWNLKYPPKEL